MEGALSSLFAPPRFTPTPLQIAGVWNVQFLPVELRVGKRLQQLRPNWCAYVQVSKDGKSRSMSMPTPEGISIEIVETLIERDDENRFYTYRVTGPGLPYTDHWSKFAVVPSGATSKIVWETRFANVGCSFLSLALLIWLDLPVRLQRCAAG